MTYSGSAISRPIWGLLHPGRISEHVVRATDLLSSLSSLRSVQEEIDSLEEEKESELMEAHEELHCAQEEIVNLRQAAEEAAGERENEIATLQEELCRIRAELEHLQQTTLEYELEITTLRAEIQMKSDSQQKKNSEEVTQLQGAVQNLQVECRNLAQECRVLQDDNKQLRDSLQQMEQQSHRVLLIREKGALLPLLARQMQLLPPLVTSLAYATILCSSTELAVAHMASDRGRMDSVESIKKLLTLALLIQSQAASLSICCGFAQSTEGFKTDIQKTESRRQKYEMEAKGLPWKESGKGSNVAGLSLQENLSRTQKDQENSCDKIAPSDQVFLRDQLEDGRVLKEQQIPKDRSSGDIVTSTQKDQKMESIELGSQSPQRHEERGLIDELGLRHRLLQAEEKALSVQHECEGLITELRALEERYRSSQEERSQLELQLRQYKEEIHKLKGTPHQ
eukprot:g45238.t1